MNLKIASLLALLLFAAMSCTKPGPGGDNGGAGGNANENTGDNNGGQIDVTPFFKVDLPDEYVVNSDPGAISWAVSTNIETWTATSSEGWCKPEVSNSTLLLRIDDYDPKTENGAYIYDPPRVCTIEVKAGNVYSKTFKLVQQCRIGFDFPYLTSAVTIPPTGGVVDVVVRTNAYKWTARTEASWLKLECVDAYTLRITSTPRSEQSDEIREARVLVYPVSDETDPSWITVKDSQPTVGGSDWGYGDHTNWD